MIFQDPMTSLNPVLTVGDQIARRSGIHLRLSRQGRRWRAPSSCCDLVGIPDAGASARATTRTSSPAACASA